MGDPYLESIHQTHGTTITASFKISSFFRAPISYSFRNFLASIQSCRF